MVKIRENLTEVEGFKFDPYPEGPYNGRVIEVAEATTQNGNPQVVVKYRIEDGEFAGKVFTHYQTLSNSEGAQKWRKGMLDAHGVSYGADGWDPGDLNGKKVVFILRAKKDNPERREIAAFRTFANGETKATAAPGSIRSRFGNAQ